MKLTDSLTHMQTLYLQNKADAQKLTGTTPDHDQLVQLMLEDEVHLTEYERYFLADLTRNQTENLFIHHQIH